MKRRRREITSEELEDIHRRKTGAIIAASCQIGAIVAGAENGRGRENFVSTEKYLGLAFQITDDILDVTAEQSELGKSIGKGRA